MTKSFSIDHRTLLPGFYFQEERNGVYIYDWRIYAPKEHLYLTQEENHTLEHYFANYLNEHPQYKKVAIFPYGCLTGFGVILGRTINQEEIVQLLNDFIGDTLKSKKIPGNSIESCGNPSTLNFDAAKSILKVIKSDLDNKKYQFEYKDFL